MSDHTINLCSKDCKNSDRQPSGEPDERSQLRDRGRDPKVNASETCKAQSIPCPSLKAQTPHLKKLRRILNRLDILVHHQRQLAKAYRDLSRKCARLAENMEHMDVIAFEVRLEVDKMEEGREF